VAEGQEGDNEDECAHERCREYQRGQARRFASAQLPNANSIHLVLSIVRFGASKFSTAAGR
jgi:hypothetical protein